MLQVPVMLPEQVVRSFSAEESNRQPALSGIQANYVYKRIKLLVQDFLIQNVSMALLI